MTKKKLWSILDPPEETADTNVLEFWNCKTIIFHEDGSIERMDAIAPLVITRDVINSFAL